MKNNLIACLFLFVAGSSYAQLSKHQFVIGGFGNFSYSDQKTKFGYFNETTKLTAFDVSADGGYFIINGLCAGLRFTGSLNKIKQQSTNASYTINSNGGPADTMFSVTQTEYLSKIYSYGFSPFVRYYFLKATHKINVIAEANYTHSFDASGYTSASQSVSYINGNAPPQLNINTNTTLAKTQSNALGIQAGPAIFFDPKVSMEVLFGWQYLTGHNITTNSFTIGLGFHAYLNKL
jgi:hypothetical protein